MTSIPVVLDDGLDILDISSRLRPGHGGIYISGSISPEVENEIQKSIRFAAQLADLGEFIFPDLAVFDLHLNFTARLSRRPIVGTSYGLGLGIEILCLFSGRRDQSLSCYTGELDESGGTTPVGSITEKRSAAANAGFSRIFLPTTQLDFFCPIINQVPVESIYQAWGVLTYGS